MEKPLISVIVPVYNVASFLPACLDSILSQTYLPSFAEMLLIVRRKFVAKRYSRGALRPAEKK